MEDAYDESEFDDQDADAANMFRGPNDGVYEKEELRIGPPLDYVAEKSRSAMELNHLLIRTLSRADIAAAKDKDRMLSQARGAFRYQLTGYLALQNMLALAHDPDLFERLERFSCEDFHDWLDRIAQQGTTTG